jgi:hypothetical protein
MTYQAKQPAVSRQEYGGAGTPTQPETHTDGRPRDRALPSDSHAMATLDGCAGHPKGARGPVRSGAAIIRGDLALTVHDTLVHCSDWRKRAGRVIALWFPDL